MTAIMAADVNGDDRVDLIARAANGDLFAYPHSATDVIGTGMWAGGRVLVGIGQQSMTAIF
ncbi:hypothetical protein [Actinomadura alba]|uniref:VCBS repeat-containing protein n=1 Tax=Actinomadura alba TaxID=406431 RepID=A0ABR7M0R0_9ACTN|nr:hypothetical protein [Actinomadura alba]MBC6470701.1 hypothetical protein [Actinomadura alba]